MKNKDSEKENKNEEIKEEKTQKKDEKIEEENKEESNKKESNKKESNKKESNKGDTQLLKKGFFQKVWFSIDKIERYPELSAEGFGSAIKYLAMLILFIAIISTIIVSIKTVKKVNEISEYIKNDAPKFSYKDGTLTVDCEQPQTIENEDLGTIIIDTNTEDSTKINEYYAEIVDTGAIILKDKVYIKQSSVQQQAQGVNYKTLLEQIGTNEFDNQSMSEFLSSSKMNSLYTNMILNIFIYNYVEQFLDILLCAFVISIFGYIASMILRLKLKFVAVYNMGIYAVTLSTIFYMIYLIINGITGFVIKYFDVMYMLISAIYIMAAIFMLKLEFNKKQDEVKKVVEVEKQVKEEKESN